jgi:hypothetical protein
MTAVTRTRRQAQLLEAGDVLITHPDSEYWGCALVLTARGATDGFDPMCHIGITPAIFRREFAFSELDLDRLSILEFDREIRLADGTYTHLRRETCIGIYSRRYTASVRVIGRVDVASLSVPQLSFDVGNGADGGWPLYGPVQGHLGSEAVAAWRAVHDRERWLQYRDAARKRTEEVFARIRESERRKRLARKTRRS